MKYVSAIIFAAFTTVAVQADSVSTPKAEAEAVLNAMLPFGQQMLEKHGEFYPYGGAMTTDGKIVSVGGYEGSENPPSQKLIELIAAGFREGAKTKTYKAIGLFYDVRVVPPDASEKTDAIAVALDHRDNYSVIVYFPYKIANGKVQMGAVFASPGENKVFGK